MKRALVVGVDYYEQIAGLYGCVNDAVSVAQMLERNGDGSVNFACKLMTAQSSIGSVSRAALKEEVRNLFAGDGEIALFYFAGHGHIETTGGYLCASDCRSGDDGLALSDVVTLANESKFRNRILILDSCHSGIAGNPPTHTAVAELADGMTILTASTAEQYASESAGSGTFTTLLLDALRGAAANLVGDVTPGSAYAHVDQSLGGWSQRPVFKTNVKSFVSLRKIVPPLDLAELRRITDFFPCADSEFELDPTYEPERPEPLDPMVPPPNPDNNRVFAILQKYNRVHLVVPVGAPHMWHAAMHCKAVRLTVLGEHYRRLASQQLL